jgi:crotonobetainyl-CoA:carnitine CoA-transferase CaiB-like acyl-CoA transferase
MRIVDFSTHLSGPMASHLLAELGADVVKIERPGIGDGNRGLAPLIEGAGMFHWALNSGVRSMVADARSPEWPTVVAAAARWADAVIVGLRPADAAKRGLDLATLVQAKPNLVYCSISGYGDRGPWKDLRGHGQTLDSYAGLGAVQWDDDDLPSTPPGWRSSGTTLAGVFGALGVMAGLYRRDHEGGPQLVSTSVWSSALWWSWRDVACLLNTGAPWTEYNELGTRYAMYPTADHRAILVAPSEKAFWQTFCSELGLPEEWREHGSWERSGMDHGEGPEYRHERRVIAETMRRRPMAEWVERLAAAGIPFAPVLTLDEVLASEHAAAEGVIGRVEGPGDVRIVRSPVRVGSGGSDDAALLPSPPITAPSALGGDSDAVRRDFGLGD